ncbi:MAG: ATP-binding protein, partial [Deltaproteobacteria bacterium]|nr:ATP-binding protein [Deltaproteobacteria bacterium]
MIWGAQIYIEETIANILANSVKYTPPDGKVTLETKEEGDFILVSVSDTVIGVPQDEIPRIFDEFYRARNAREIEKNGTGLGLSI